MRIVRKISLAATFILLALFSSACGGGIIQSGTNSGNNGSGGFHLASYIQDHIKNHKKLVIRLDYHNPSLAFAIPLREGVGKAASELGVDAQLIGPASGSAADQVAELQTLISQQQIDALAVSSASSDALAVKPSSGAVRRSSDLIASSCPASGVASIPASRAGTRWPGFRPWVERNCRTSVTRAR